MRRRRWRCPTAPEVLAFRTLLPPWQPAKPRSRPAMTRRCLHTGLPRKRFSATRMEPILPQACGRWVRRPWRQPLRSPGPGERPAGFWQALRWPALLCGVPGLAREMFRSQRRRPVPLYRLWPPCRPRTAVGLRPVTLLRRQARTLRCVHPLLHRHCRLRLQLRLRLRLRLLLLLLRQAPLRGPFQLLRLPPERQRPRKSRRPGLRAHPQLPRMADVLRPIPQRQAKAGKHPRRANYKKRPRAVPVTRKPPVKVASFWDSKCVWRGSVPTLRLPTIRSASSGEPSSSSAVMRNCCADRRRTLLASVMRAGVRAGALARGTAVVRRKRNGRWRTSCGRLHAHHPSPKATSGRPCTAMKKA